MATIIKPDGETTEIKPADGETFTLKELQTIVGGYIERFPTDDGRHVFMNEDGKRLELPINPKATELCRNLLIYGDFIVGTVVILSREEQDTDPDDDDDAA